MGGPTRRCHVVGRSMRLEGQRSYTVIQQRTVTGALAHNPDINHHRLQYVQNPNTA